MTVAVKNLVPRRGERLFAVGDIHGCMTELGEIESKVKSSATRTNKKFKLISVGDLIDRGPNSNLVLDVFAKGKELGTHEMVLGNHEMFLILAFIGLRPDVLDHYGIEVSWFHAHYLKIFAPLARSVSHWRSNGGEAFFRSYGASINDHRTWDLIPADHLKLIFESPLVIETPKAIISHALLNRDDVDTFRDMDIGTSTAKQELSEALVRTLWERKAPNDIVKPTKRYVSGHTPLERVLRHKKTSCIQIDTGAVYGNALTAIALDNFRTHQVICRGMSAKKL